jgi:hypothetical protein
MIDAATWAQINGEYVMPPEAGPAWRAAHAAGIDMSLIEENLRRSPWERLLANDRAPALIRQLACGQSIKDGATH